MGELVPMDYSITGSARVSYFVDKPEFPDVTKTMSEFYFEVSTHEILQISSLKNSLHFYGAIKKGPGRKITAENFLHVKKPSFFARVRTTLAYLFGNNYIIPQIHIKCKFKKTVIK